MKEPQLDQNMCSTVILFLLDFQHLIFVWRQILISVVIPLRYVYSIRFWQNQEC